MRIRYLNLDEEIFIHQIKIIMKKYNLIFLLFSILLGACGSNSFLSKNPKNKIKIDGKLNDWSGGLKYIEDQNSAVGVKNNDDYLFISFTSSDRIKIEQIFSMGFTVWLKPEDSKTLGILFPLKSDEKTRFNPGNRFRTRQNSTRMIKNYLNKHNEFLIINDDDFPLYGAKIDKNTGYKISLSYNKGKFIYELRIPFKLHQDKNIPLIKIPNKKLDIVIETGENEVNLNNNNVAQPGGGGGLGRRSRPRISPFGTTGLQEKLEISLSVQLN